MRRGLIIFAHGARDPRWAEPFYALLARVRALSPGTPVQLAFLEIMEPDLERAATELIARDIDVIRIAPVFFGQGGHIRRDLPQRIEALRGEHPGVEFECVNAAGEDGDVLDAIARYCLRALDAK